MIKVCSKCGEPKTADQFKYHPRTWDLLGGVCRDCQNSRRRDTRPSGKDSVQRRTDNTRAQQRRWETRKRKSSPEFRLVKSLRSRLRQAAFGHHGHALELVGCSVLALRAHLESLFSPGMTWGNYGRWHIDHVRPCSKFDLTDPAQQRVCFHYRNLQPLWAIDNIRKGAKITRPGEVSGSITAPHPALVRSLVPPAAKP
jgi:hypothetical protein